MSDRFRVAVIGCGNWAAHAHARGYLETGECELVAAADPNAGHLERFAAAYGSAMATYIDYQDLLEDERPDIVSVCTGPRFQSAAVLDAASADVRAIHGEAPLAPTWGEAKAMRKAVGQKGIQLTFNLAHRLLPSVRAARHLMDGGRMGDVQGTEGSCADLLDRGTHMLDLLHFWNRETAVEWVLGQVDCRTERTAQGVRIEDQSLAEIRFRNRLPALIRTGLEYGTREEVRIVSAHGVMEWRGIEAGLRFRSSQDAHWRTLEGLEADDWGTATTRGIADLVQCLSTGAEPLLRSEFALRGTEVVFATYESSRRRGRVDLPLPAEDSALLSMLAAGELGPRATRGPG